MKLIPEFITGLGQWRAGHGAIVTDWMPTKAEALAEFRHLQDERRIEQLENLLHDLREYFDQRADADFDCDGFVANEEMRIMMRIDEEL